MKSMENDNRNNNNNNNNNGSLSFSLSPHMNTSQPPPATTTAANAMIGLYGDHDPHDIGGLYTYHLPFMPLKSDGSLCFHQVYNNAPKLEDFFGANQTLGSHPQILPFVNHNGFITQTQIAELNNDDDNDNNKNGIEMHRTIGEQEVPGGIRTLVQGNYIERMSISPGSQSSSCVTGSQSQIHPQISANNEDCMSMESKKRVIVDEYQKQIVHRKSLDTFGQRTSQYRGVTRHRWTGRYEAHLWDNTCKREGQSRKGRQVYLGGYDAEEKAARAYDLAALKYWGPSTHINFPLENYEQELEGMKNMTRQEFVAHLRRKSSGFSRGASIYRGVTRHHQHGRWQARIGRVAGNKDLYLGTFSTQEEAAEAYDIAAIKFRGANAVTNFNMTRYNVERIMASTNLLGGELARRNKESPRTACSQPCDLPQLVSHNNNISSDNNNNDNVDQMNRKSVISEPPSQQELCTCIRQTFNRTYDNSMIKIDHAMGSTLMVGTQPVSEPSSPGTTLSDPREGSLDKSSNQPLAFTDNVAPFASKFFANSIPMSHLSVFPAWADS